MFAGPFRPYNDPTTKVYIWQVYLHSYTCTGDIQMLREQKSMPRDEVNPRSHLCVCTLITHDSRITKVHVIYYYCLMLIFKFIVQCLKHHTFNDLLLLWLYWIPSNVCKTSWMDTFPQNFNLDFQMVCPLMYVLLINWNVVDLPSSSDLFEPSVYILGDR